MCDRAQISSSLPLHPRVNGEVTQARCDSVGRWSVLTQYWCESHRRQERCEIDAVSSVRACTWDVSPTARNPAGPPPQSDAEISSGA
jgi:hypothetical protein